MELDYFRIYLQTYLSDHGFEPEVMENPIVINNIERANEEFETARRNGYTVEGAIELALQQLFIGIGDSPREALSEILVDEFGSRIGLDESKLKDERGKIDFQLLLEFWTNRLSKRGVLSGFELENGIGLDHDILEESRDIIFSRIDQHLNIHGIQQRKTTE